MWWASGQQQASTAAAADDLQADAVKHGRFKFFQLPGSSISSGANTGSSSCGSNQTATALKFWQTGLHAAASAPRAFSDAPCGGDQLQPQKSFTNLLFGKARRSSSGGGAPPAAAPGNRRPSDAATNSWRPSFDGGSRQGSGRSSDSGTLRASPSFGTQMMMSQQQPAAGQEQQQHQHQHQQGSCVWASLATGEGPLSKSHSLLARASMPQELAVGKGLECVAEDEREGRDSPQPGTGCTLEPALMATFNPAQHSHHLSSLRVQLAGPGRATSPMASFSFGNKPEDEQPHSPNFLLRASVSSRLMERGQSAGTPPGPLMRASTALACTRVDPFHAPEPQPQPFVEQMRAEDAAMSAAGSAAREAAAAAPRGGFVGALRRSMGGALRAGSMAAGGMAAAGPAVLAAAATAPAGLLARRQAQQPQPLLLDGSSPGPLTAAALQASPSPTAGEMVAFLDLDATRAYALGVHEVMEGLQAASPSAAGAAAMAGQQHQQEDAAGAAARAAVAMTAAAEAARAASPPRPPVSDEIVPAEESVDEQQQKQATSSRQQEVQQQLEQQHNLRRLQLPSPALSPQSSGVMPPLPLASAPAAERPPPPPQQQQQQQQPGTLAAGMVQSLRRSKSSGSINILGRPPMGHGSKQQLGSGGAAVRLTDVYRATSGNLTPLSAGLTGIRRQSSSNHSSKATLPPRARTSPRALVSESSMQAAALPAAGMGPLAAQHSSTMLHAKKQAGAAVAGPQEGPGPGGKNPWGWQSLGLPTGPGAPLADPPTDPMAQPRGNKYAASWGLADVAATAAATPGGGLSRQASAVAGGLSRQQSQAALQGQLSRQGSAMSQRQSPRYPDQQQGVAGAPARQYSAGAAGRYAQRNVSVTPVESPRSGAGTPRRASDTGRQGQGGGNAGKTLQSRRISDVGSAASEDSGAYASADEHSRASSFSGYTSAASTGPGGSMAGPSGAWQRSNSARQLGSSSRKMPSPIPVPPAFFHSNRPTSAQAAVAAAWSPNKHASAMVQAPAYVRSAYVSPEASGVHYGESPRGLAGAAAAYSSVSPRGAYAQPGSAAPRGNNTAAGSAQQQQRLLPQQQAAYAGGYTVQGGPAPPGTREQQQQQQVVTAVDLARSRSMRRTSSFGGAAQGAAYGSRQPEAPGYLGAARGGAAGVRGGGAAAGKAAYGQRQLQGNIGGRGLVAGEYDDY
ncbi:hypothetical protein COO60DRAFT_1697816 [Scenedesmus sp. NREL 46B-D3]|nr:hypothetical protein COO60DRAFT_1697816 [Scenedesmus sp. NREL 46B-D3]